MLRHRIGVVALLYLASLGILIPVEWVWYPARRASLDILVTTHVVAFALGFVAWRLPSVRRGPRTFASALSIACAASFSWYHVVIGLSVERLAMALTCGLSGLVVILPWGWPPQLVVGLGAVCAIALASASGLSRTDSAIYSQVGLAVVAATTVLGAYFLDRHRRQAFVSTAQHAEEASIASALLRVGETLSVHREQDDMLEHVNALALEALGCDWSSTLVRDLHRGSFHLRGNAGSLPELRTALEQLEFSPGAFPALDALRPGTVVEIADAATQPYVPAELLRRMEVSSVLCASIARGTEVIGVLAAGYHCRTGPFSSKQHRLILGIAHAASVAVENARLIGDLRAASRLKSEFVATMSHELRTPINVITGYTDLVLEGGLGPLTVPQQDTLGRVRRAAVELLDLVNATLDLGRLEAGRETVTLAPVDLAALIEGLDHELEPLVPATVMLCWQNTVEGDPLVSDGPKLKTILKNLVGNALKFTQAGVVEVTLAWQNRRLGITVRDTGVGIAEADLPLIFEMFRQVEATGRRRVGGVGLGLHIVKRLVEVLEGTITVESVPGRGSTFTVTLPAEHDAPAGTQVSHATGRS